MSFSVEDSIFIAADHKIAGPVAYESYPGQILPADLSKIIWYDSTFGGSDTTGDGSYATPYATREKCLELVTLLRFYILDRSMSGRFETDPDERVYWNPATGDDGDDGLTEGTAVETYAAAKAAAVGAGRGTIHALGSFTMTDLLDFRTQGEIGETLTYEPAASAIAEPMAITDLEGYQQAHAIAASGSTVIAITLLTSVIEVHRSSDYGKTFSLISLTTTNFKQAYGLATDGQGTWVLAGSSNSAATTIFTSHDDGLTWTRHLTFDTQIGSVAWSGSNFVAVGFNRTSTTDCEIWTSANGDSWTSRTQAWGSFTWNASLSFTVASNGSGIVCATTQRSANKSSFLQVSTDHGVTWVDKSSLLSGYYGHRVKFCGGRFCVLTITVSSSIQALFFSVDPLTTWTPRTGIFGSSIYTSKDIAFSEKYQAWLLFIYDEGTFNSSSDLVAVTDATLTTIHTDSVTPAVRHGLQVIVNEAQEALLIDGDGGSPSQTWTRRYEIAANLHADSANLKGADSINLSAVDGVKFSNITSAPVTGNALTIGEDVEAYSSKLKSVDAVGLLSIAKTSIIKLCMSTGLAGAALRFAGCAIAQDDIKIERNTFIGGADFQNAGGTKKELIRDNIFYGDVSAVAPVKVAGGDISGGRSNVDAETDVQAINPMIKDEAIGKLQRESDGSPANSYLCSTSNYFTAADGEKADPGAWSGIYTLEAELYQYPFWMPKPLTDGAIRHGKRVTSGDLQGLLGEIDVYNNPDLQQEILTITLKTVPSDLLAHFRVLESLRDTKVLVNTNPEKWKTQNSFTLSAAASAGDIVLNIDPAVVYHGQWFQWAGRKYYIRIVLDDESAATRVVLNAKLSDAIPDGTAIPLSYLEGQGVYNVKVRDSDMTRRFAYDPTLKSGYVLEFTRPWNQ